MPVEFQDKDILGYWLIVTLDGIYQTNWVGNNSPAILSIWYVAIRRYNILDSHHQGVYSISKEYKTYT